MELRILKIYFFRRNGDLLVKDQILFLLTMAMSRLGSWWLVMLKIKVVQVHAGGKELVKVLGNKCVSLVSISSASNVLCFVLSVLLIREDSSADIKANA